MSGIHLWQFSDYIGKCIQVSSHVGENGAASWGSSQVVPCLPHRGGEWLPCFRSLCFRSKASLKAQCEVLWKQGWDMACPKAEVGLLQALRPEFCCLNYSCPISFIFYCWGLMWRKRSRLIGLKIKFRNYFNNLIYYFGHFYRQLKPGHKEASE